MNINPLWNTKGRLFSDALTFSINICFPSRSIWSWEVGLEGCQEAQEHCVIHGLAIGDIKGRVRGRFIALWRWVGRHQVNVER